MMPTAFVVPISAFAFGLVLMPVAAVLVLLTSTFLRVTIAIAVAIVVAVSTLSFTFAVSSYLFSFPTFHLSGDLIHGVHSVVVVHPIIVFPFSRERLEIVILDFVFIRWIIESLILES